MKFVLEPLCREHLHTSGDIPNGMQEASEFAKSLLPTVDTETAFKRYHNPEAFFIEDLTCD